MSSLHNEIRKKIICETKQIIKEKRETTGVHYISRKKQLKGIFEAMRISLKVLSGMNSKRLKELENYYNDYSEKPDGVRSYWAYYISVTDAIFDIEEFHRLNLDEKTYGQRKIAYYNALQVIQEVNGEKIEPKFPANRGHTYLELSFHLENSGFNKDSIQYVYDFVKHNFDRQFDGKKFKDSGNRKYNKSSWENIINKKKN